MKIIIKKLRGDTCTLDVLPNTTVTEIKREVSKKLGISVEEQKLLLLGRPLADDQTIASYPSIKDGTKLNLVVKKPEGLYEVSLKYFKKHGMSDADAANTANRLLRIIQNKFNKLSWDDIDRLSLDCLMDERGQSRPSIEKETDCDDNMFTL
ncbi:unnamed protein product [Parnassius mnemosyne]|uniref:Ubiquitin-like domain-containing protein n=1 Tax=Parnassius mnemosyne TaxID=213953 RepID=A0AAV1MCF3_9NEOP